MSSGAPRVFGFLARMEAHSRERARALRGHAAELRARAESTAPPPRLTLSEFDVIAEVKLTSPAEGVLASGEAEDVARRARAYARAEAAAVSVLTEDMAFGGDLSHVEAAAAATRDLQVPVLRKDFLVDPLQLLEARAAGAGGVLLITRLVDDARLSELLACAAEADLFVLLEAFDAEDLERTRAVLELRPPTAAPVLVGVNARDLRTLRVDPRRQLALGRNLPSDRPCVAESGILTPEDAAAARRAGYGLALVGTALMRAEDPGQLVRALRSAGRAAAPTSEARP